MLVAVLALAVVCGPQAAMAAQLGAGSGSPPALPRRSSPRSPTSPQRAPSAPPLSTTATGTGGGGEEVGGGGAGAQLDPLVSNGLGSPTCKGALAGGELSASARRNCETSGFVAAPAPTGNYGLDVHIDTGTFGLGAGAIPNAVQDIVVTPLWMGLVWAVHALIVMLEWCFSLDLLDGSAAIGLGGGLREMQASFTEPWLPIALACASVLALYHGLVRRRVAQTLGDAVLMGAMMIAGLWVIADPTGTIGALGQWADEASLGTLAVAAQGAPRAPGRALTSSLDALFSDVIEAPWCYLEFGDVAWCREPSQLDPGLRAAALSIAAQESALAACEPSPEPLLGCTPATGAQARALRHSAQLLREARSNAAIFLALPANGVARNSINESGSLLRIMCQSAEASECRGPTAAQAEFRTSGGTLARLGGLLLIAGGLLGMLLLLGFLAVRLLMAAVFSLLYLLLAPAIVIAPAFGDGGRALFRRWGGQLLGAVVSKLVFSFLLGVVLAVLWTLSGLVALGWWTQWLLMSSLWWGAYLRRHQALGAASSALAAHRAGEQAERRSLARRVGQAIETPRTGIALARRTKKRFSKQAPGSELSRRAQAGRQLASENLDAQVRQALEHEYGAAREHSGEAAAIQHELAGGRAQLERIERARSVALGTGEHRRAAELGARGERVRAEVGQREQALSTAQRTVREGERAHRRTGAVYTPQRRERYERLLERQAALPPGGRAAPDGARRDYAALAGLAGLGREAYERLDSRRQRAARVEIDRELALRRELGQAANALAADAETPTPGRRTHMGTPPSGAQAGERRDAARELDRRVRRRMQEHGHAMPSSRRPSDPVERWRTQTGTPPSEAHPEGHTQKGAGRQAGENGRAEHADAGTAQQSSVMRDALEVAARRKRQLGRGRQ
jgi:hypothetical protein